MPAFRGLVGLDLWNEAAPDAATLLKFRRLLERHELTRQLFGSVNEQLSRVGLLMREGTMVDATLIDAPSSTKNADKARDPEMHQTRKGNQWYFAMKAHIGADEDSGLVHTLHTTAANEADVSHTEHLLHRDEQRVWADAGYLGADKREAVRDKPIEWQIASRRSTIKKLSRKAVRRVNCSSRSRRSRRGCGPESSTPSIFSRTCLVNVRHATRAWRKTPPSSIACSPWSTWSWRRA
jgi:IS5 family transposase